MKHTFGGLWTQEKLQVLEKYLQFYATALKNQPFTLHYVDAFAGTGSHDPKVKALRARLFPMRTSKYISATQKIDLWLLFPYICDYQNDSERWCENQT